MATCIKNIVPASYSCRIISFYTCSNYIKYNGLLLSCSLGESQITPVYSTPQTWPYIALGSSSKPPCGVPRNVFKWVFPYYVDELQSTVPGVNNLAEWEAPFYV